MPDVATSVIPAASWLSPPQIAKQLGIDPAKIIAWINSGQLNAINVAENLAGRPRYRVSSQALEDFLRRRSTSPAPQPVRRRKALFQRKYYT